MTAIWSYMAGLVICSFAYGILCMRDEELQEYGLSAFYGFVLWPFTVPMLAAFWLGCRLEEFLQDRGED